MMVSLFHHFSPNCAQYREPNQTQQNWYHSFSEDVYVDIRTYEKGERTMEFVLDGIMEVQGAFQEEGLVANARLKTYEGEKILLKK